MIVLIKEGAPEVGTYLGLVYASFQQVQRMGQRSRLFHLRLDGKLLTLLQLLTLQTCTW